MPTVKQLDDWLVDSKPGDRFVYHRGFHLLDPNGEKIAVGVEAYRAYENGLVNLHVQRCQHKPNFFNYIVVRRQVADQLVNARRHLV